MSTLHKRIEQMWWRKSPPPPLLLRCIEPLYAAISHIHLQRRAAHAVAPPLPMISVGNISAGGSGKTPFVLWLADALLQTGHKPVLLCRGDGGSQSGAVVVQRDSAANLVGDEAKMLAEQSTCPVIAARDRITGAELASTLGSVIILDDGFQYRQLQRSCDIVLVPAEGLGNGHQIPAGPLREPLSALQRADMIVRTGSPAELAGCTVLSDQPEWYWQRRSGPLFDAMHLQHDIPAAVSAVTAIARPQRFFDDLKAHGIPLSDCHSFPDHHPFSTQDVKTLLALQTHIAVTAKDAVKLQPLWPADRPLWVLPLQGEAQTGLLTAITTFLPA